MQKLSIDKYGRTIGYVLYHGKNLSLELLKKGLAWHYKYYSDDQEMARLEETAKADRVTQSILISGEKEKEVNKRNSKS